uniref:MATH domain-containing protein n=1 Tax=Oryza meridionalis TaxID=40149 RepID=A0A0E0EY39_9ORYZ
MPSSSAATARSQGHRPSPPYSSASAIIGGTVTGHHVVKIEGHSYTKEKLPNGNAISSLPFTVGDHQWRINYYPNGNGSEEADFVSVFLCLAAGQPVKARATFSLLN